MSKMTKIGAVILNPARDKMLVVRKEQRTTLIIPGGRPERGETDEEALARELREELCVDMRITGAIGEYVEPAEFDDATLTMRVYDVEIQGTPKPDNEITEAYWVGRNYADTGIRLGSTLTNHVIPALIARGDLA